MELGAEANGPVSGGKGAGWTRRAFVLGGLATCLWATSGGAALAAAPSKAVRELTLLNLHTGERVRAPYWERGRYQRDVLAAFDQVLRDHRTDEVHDIDPRLFDALHALGRRLGERDTFHVISGYRSPKSNALLRQTGTGVAKKSYHMRGMAIDVRVPQADLDRVHRAAKSLKAGGVGKYTKSNFIHMDVGPVRYW